MNKRYKYFVLFVTLVILIIPGTAFAKDLQDDRVVAGGTFTLESGETLDGSLIVFGGTAATAQDSLVEGDAVVFGGILTIDGTVEGNVVGVGGVVNLKENAIVEGDLTTIAATLNRDPGAQVDGQVITEFNFSPALTILPETIGVPPTFSQFDPMFDFDPMFNPIGFSFWRVIWFIFRTLLWGALAALVAMFLPNPTTRTSEAIVKQPVMAGGVGLLTIIVAPVILLLLLITCILSPISLLGAMALVVAWVFGRIAIGLEIGNRIAKTFDRDWPVPLAAGVGTFGLALVVDSVGVFIPCVGWLIPTLVGLFGLGGVVLTRFGTQAYPLEDESADIEEAPFPAELIEPSETPALEDQGQQADASDELPDPSGDSE
jgi:cytoskeletal protein CcmA (bactofilin family)